MNLISCHRMLYVVVIALAFIGSVTSHQLVVYWGQNAAHIKPGATWEKPLSHFCKTTRYDVIVLAFMHKFFSSSNKDNFPAINFANHCGEAISARYPELLRCPKIESGILECQRRGKKVLLSLGGAGGNYGFSNNNQAKLLAQRVWDLFLKGTTSIQRPFGSAVLDGIDLDIEKGLGHTGYAAFVTKLRQLMRTDAKQYLITGAPQCPYPDAHMGPDTSFRTGTVLSLVAHEFDHLYVQYYNNICYPSFLSNFKKWRSLSENATILHGKGPKIFVGLPADRYAASGNLNGARYYQPVTKVSNLYKTLKTYNVFGGFMLWDAGFDQNNVINGKTYGEHVASLFQITATTTPPSTKATEAKTTPVETPPVPSTKAVSMTTIKRTATKRPFSCSRRPSGIYIDNNNCRGFIKCSNGDLYHFACPPNLMFNPKLQVCDWPRNVLKIRPECI